MKKLFFLLGVFAIMGMSFAQTIDIRQNTYQKVSISFTPGALSVEEITVPEGVFSLVSMPEYGESYNPGDPQLPQLSKLLQIPVCDEVVATVTNAQYTEYDAADLGVHHPLYPSQVAASKSGPQPPFSYNPEVYSTNAFYAQPLVKVEKAGVRRSAAMANLYVSPVQYNPVSQKIRIYTQIDVDITFTNVDMTATNDLQKYASPMFSLDRSLVINSMEHTRDEFATTPVKYLIIANNMFSTNELLQEFVSWKRRLGYLVELYYTSDPAVGSTTTSIKSFIQSKYDAGTEEDPAPTYLLFIGDVAQLPPFNAQTNNNHVTDLYYATLSGNDYIPDCYYGRLSATNNDQLDHQLEKILMYEQFTMPDPSYLGNAVLIAGTDANYGPTHANGQINYVNNNYINTDNPRYSNVMVHLYNCSSQAALIRSEVSAGAGWANYTAHGSETSWADPEFNVSHVYQLQNTDKYGLMIGNCCVSGHFNTSECFGEALLRAEKKGAMGYIGASNNSYWGEDFYWAVGVTNSITANPTYTGTTLGMYDKLFHTHGEDYQYWVSTIGGIITAGNMTVQSSSSSLKQYYWEIYHCFGDPSVRAYLGVPSTMAVTASAVITTNEELYTVQTVPYAYVAITQGNTLIVMGYADENGNVVLNLPSSMNPGSYELVVLAQNYIPYFQTLQVIAPYGPYVVSTSLNVAENTVFAVGSTINMDLSLSNVGVANATQVYATLTPVNNVTMLQDSVYVGALNVNDIESRTAAFSFVMPASEDYANIPFTLGIHWNDTIVNSEVRVLVKLPKVVLDSYSTTVNDMQTSFLEPGDAVRFNMINKNVGHAEVQNGSIDLTCNYSGVKILTDPISIDGLEPNMPVERFFNVQIADTVPNSSIVPMYFHTFYDGIHTIDTLYVMVGGSYEDFESGDFTHQNWTMNNYPWEIVSGAAVHTGQYCARSKQSLPNNANSRMSITVTTQAASTLSYYRRVSTESGYDFFNLYVNTSKKESVSGDIPWTKVDVSIPAGTNTIIFSYEKDYSTTGGHDCVWVDDIILPSVGIMVIEDVTDTTGVGIEEYEMVRARVFPNPTNEWVNIESEQPAQRIVLFDLNGRMVKNVNLSGENSYQLNMGDVPAGFYLLQITFDNQKTQNLKIIKR